MVGLLAIPLLVACRAPAPPDPPETASLDRGDNGIWARRTWLHEPVPEERIEALADTLRARGITRLWPFLGPPDALGRPGWIADGVHHPVDPAGAASFLTRMAAAAPGVEVLPWTGGVLGRDIDLDDPARLGAWMEAVLALPVRGVQINVEPMPEQDAFLDLLRAWKARLGDRTLSVAAYPPPTPLHPYPDVHWSLPFLRDVCLAADDLAVMAYDTALADSGAYTELVAAWTRDLAALPPPEEGGCTVRIGVPAYEDDEPGHRPDAETLAAGIAGVRAGLAPAAPAHVRGLALYASWTVDDAEWATWDRAWRGREPVLAPPIDP